ncbi:MAG: prenyltransferase [Candidatus Nitrosotenuis sp.]
MSLSVWMRVIRIKFLLASVISVSLGLAISYWKVQSIDVVEALVTMGGVIALHASVDLLNDFWDYKRGIDNDTKRTKFSGGSGVLPDGLLKPTSVYRAGIVFLILGSLAGVYFIVIYGLIIAIILGFAVFSIYFYSTKIVDVGLGEIFVAIKGAMIVFGSVYIQTQTIDSTTVICGAIAGTLSALVLYITSFPDFDADKKNGRRTLIIMLGKNAASRLFWAFPAIIYSLVLTGILFELIPLYCILVFVTLPLIIKAGITLPSKMYDVEQLVPVMKSTLLFSRITGVLLIAGFLFAFIIN